MGECVVQVVMILYAPAKYDLFLPSANKAMQINKAGMRILNQHVVIAPCDIYLCLV